MYQIWKTIRSSIPSLQLTFGKITRQPFSHDLISILFPKKCSLFGTPALWKLNTASEKQRPHYWEIAAVTFFNWSDEYKFIFSQLQIARRNHFYSRSQPNTVVSSSRAAIAPSPPSKRANSGSVRLLAASWFLSMEWWQSSNFLIEEIRKMEICHTSGRIRR